MSLSSVDWKGYWEVLNEYDGQDVVVTGIAYVAVCGGGAPEELFIGSILPLSPEQPPGPLRGLASGLVALLFLLGLVARGRRRTAAALAAILSVYLIWSCLPYGQSRVSVCQRCGALALGKATGWFTSPTLRPVAPSLFNPYDIDTLRGQTPSRHRQPNRPVCSHVFRQVGTISSWGTKQRPFIVTHDDAFYDHALWQVLADEAPWWEWGGCLRTCSEEARAALAEALSHRHDAPFRALDGDKAELIRLLTEGMTNGYEPLAERVEAWYRTTRENH